MSVNWAQVGEDFRQKYEGTYCRYQSPKTKEKEVFSVMSIEVHDSSPPDIVLYNGRVGDLFLSYKGESELDFSYPAIGMFQYEKKALRFTRRYMRQWKKGVCESTAGIDFPYGHLAPKYQTCISESTVKAAYDSLTATTVSISAAVQKLEKEDYISVALNKEFSLGLSESPKAYWLWYHCDPIGVVSDVIDLRVKQFTQEMRDFLRDTRDYARAII